MKGVNCSWRMERHPTKSQPQEAIQNPAVRSRLGNTPSSDLSIYFGWWENAFLSFSEEEHCQGQHRIWKTLACSTDFEGHKTVLLYSKEDIDQDLFTIYSPFSSSKFLEILLLKAFQAGSDMHKPGLQHSCATRWWPENPVSIWGYSGRQKFHPWGVTYSFSTFQDGFLALCSASPCSCSQFYWEWDQSWYMDR